MELIFMKKIDQALSIKNKTDSSKYIPPHKRREIINKEILQSHNINSNQQLSSSSNHRSYIFSRHALMRKQQREISDQKITDVLCGGEKLVTTEAVTYINEITSIVMKGEQVITVLDNKRNIKCDILYRSKEQESYLIKKATEQNNDHAMCELAELYLTGELGSRDVQKAYNWLIRAASQRNSHAMCLLAQLYENGDLGKPDPRIALEWMQKAADRGNKYALAILGQSYLKQYQDLIIVGKIKGIRDLDQEKVMLEKAKNFLERSANRGSTRAMWHIAEIYRVGLCGESNLVKAIEFYSKAAKLGSPHSLQSLNDLVLQGKCNSDFFEEILEEASQFIIRTSGGLVVEIGLKQIEGQLGKNPKRGFEMIKKVAERWNIGGGNNVDAIRTLAKCYRDGKGCDPDQALAQNWFKKLKTLYEKSADLGNVYSMHKLGKMFLKGTLGKIDLEKAEQFFILAAETGNEDHIRYLGTLYINKALNYDQKVVNKTIWLKKVIEIWTKQALLGNTEDLVDLIQLYLDQELGFKDPEQLNSWLSIGIQHDSEENSETALYVAVSKGYTETVSALLELGADVNRVIQSRNTIFSTVNDNFSILTLIVNKKLITMANKIFVNSTDLQEQFVDIIKRETSIEQIVDFIIQNKGDLNATEKDQVTLLIMTCVMNNYNSVEQLIIAGADKNAKDIHATALHYAFVGNDINILKFLLKQGCDLNIPDSEGDYPETWAIERDLLDNLKAAVTIANDNGTFLLDIYRQHRKADNLLEFAKHEQAMNCVRYLQQLSESRSLDSVKTDQTIKKQQILFSEVHQQSLNLTFSTNEQSLTTQFINRLRIANVL